VRRVEVSNCSVAVFFKHRNRRILPSLAIFAVQIVLEGIGATTQKPESVPTSVAGVCSQGRRSSRGNNDEVDVLCQMMSNTIPAVDKQGAHRARTGLLLPVHEVIYDQRPARCGEQLAQANRSDGCIACQQVRRTLFEHVVLNGCARREATPKVRDPLPLTHQIYFRETKLFPFCKVFFLLISQVGLLKCTVEHVVYANNASTA
jgi:hypothetical protein